MKRTTLFILAFALQLIIANLCPMMAQDKEAEFRILPVSTDIQKRINGKSYKSNCTIPYTTLRYLRVLHWDADGNTKTGELICHKDIAQDLIDIFRELYRNHYRIARIELVDNYDADDELSMKANNTSCFNYRPIAGSKTLSKHSQGLAIDINPLINPCVSLRTGKIEPATGKPYAYTRNNKDKVSLQMINYNDLCYKLFTQHGFKWGGAWKTKKDYQHFEK